MTEATNDDFMVGSILISPQHNTMTLGEHTCRLQPKAMAVLDYLAKHQTRVINNEELLEQIWQGRVVTYNSIQKSMNALRSAFAELDSDKEYIVYFSKQGYQLVVPSVIVDKNSRSSNDSAVNNSVVTTSGNKFTVIGVALVLSVLAMSMAFYMLYSPATMDILKTEISQTVFSQVKPFVSNTGRERLIEPHVYSERVAFVRDAELDENKERQSQLFIQGTKGTQWQIGTARGNFIALAWSPSGRNLVAVDAHHKNNVIAEQQDKANYYSFHIYTLDFKAEKIIEKNLLSHWQGNVSSVSWWDEGTLIFTGSESKNFPNELYGYGIAEQNLSNLTQYLTEDTIEAITEEDLQLVAVNNKKAAILSVGSGSSSDLGESGGYLLFLDEQQQVISRWPLPFKVLSMSWYADKDAVLLLSENNELSILYTDGRLDLINYYPKIKSPMRLVRSTEQGDLVLTIAGENPEQSDNSDQELNNLSVAEMSVNRLIENGGGVLYSASQIGKNL
ncbi:winged helix-turn-helix domain-containing protein [Colwellia echini]|uniref:OmpR/PhoB-type domain-containing protein n=1 Tax=Colwellia echini TaxID=1982103 RepID=A0ABY3MZ71_9GAMM|nr:winged helix-turn-helix domain-containing protein [Colwellia echini]TYK66528.1 hypothetical protein CWS31_004090 [Colwellia echini]